MKISIKKTSKKSQMAYSEIGLIVFSIIVIGLSLYVSAHTLNLSLKNVNRDVGELNYKFPILFVHTFLYQKIEKDDLKKLNLNENANYAIKDLLYIGSDSALEVVNEYKSKYIENLNTMSGKNNLFKLYQKFSEDNDCCNSLGYSNLLYIEKVDDFGKVSNDLDLVLANKNYFFYMRTQTGEYLEIFFKKVDMEELRDKYEYEKMKNGKNFDYSSGNAGA